MKKIIGYFSLSLFILCLCFNKKLTNNLDHFFPITKIQVEAPFLYVDKQSIQAIITDHTQSGLLSVNSASIKKTLYTLPLVRQVSVKKIWPGTLFIKINERRPIAIFNDTKLLDEQGELFKSNNVSTENLAKLHGMAGCEKELLHEYKKLSRLLISVSLTLNLLEIRPSMITLVTIDGLKVLLSNKGAEEQLLRFIHVYPELVKKRSTSIQRVDMRYKHGLAVKW